MAAADENELTWLPALWWFQMLVAGRLMVLEPFLVLAKLLLQLINGPIQGGMDRIALHHSREGIVMLGGGGDFHGWALPVAQIDNHLDGGQPVVEFADRINFL